MVESNAYNYFVIFISKLFSLLVSLHKRFTICVKYYFFYFIIWIRLQSLFPVKQKKIQNSISASKKKINLPTEWGQKINGNIKKKIVHTEHIFYLFKIHFRLVLFSQNQKYPSVEMSYTSPSILILFPQFFYSLRFDIFDKAFFCFFSFSFSVSNFKTVAKNEINNMIHMGPLYLFLWLLFSSCKSSTLKYEKSIHFFDQQPPHRTKKPGHQILIILFDLMKRISLFFCDKI